MYRETKGKKVLLSDMYTQIYRSRVIIFYKIRQGGHNLLHPLLSFKNPQSESSQS